MICTLPPEGWWCSREPGHEGPCSGRPYQHIYYYSSGSDALDIPLEPGELFTRIALLGKKLYAFTNLRVFELRKIP